MRTHASLGNQSFSSMSRYIDTSTYVPIDANTSFSSTKSNGHPHANSHAVEIGAKTKQLKSHLDKR
jgi:hypothetical protein